MKYIPSYNPVTFWDHPSKNGYSQGNFDYAQSWSIFLKGWF